MGAKDGYYDWNFEFSNGDQDKLRALRSNKILLSVDANINHTTVDHIFWGYNGTDFQDNKISLVHSFICAN